MYATRDWTLPVRAAWNTFSLRAAFHSVVSVTLPLLPIDVNESLRSGDGANRDIGDEMRCRGVLPTLLRFGILVILLVALFPPFQAS